VGVNVPPRLDVGGGKSDNLAVFENGGAGWNRVRGSLVAGRDVVEKDNVLIGKPLSAAQRVQRHHYAVVRVQPDA
jgi:hypothetical protein